MPALLLETDTPLIKQRLADPGTLLLACLCAEWCGTCREYRPVIDALADANPDVCVVWIDIESDADRFADFDDLDVENFPTILIEDAKAVRFFGTVLPQSRVVERMLANIVASPGRSGAPKLRPAMRAQ
jgi:thioredoxin 1